MKLCQESLFSFLTEHKKQLRHTTTLVLCLPLASHPQQPPRYLELPRTMIVIFSFVRLVDLHQKTQDQSFADNSTHVRSYVTKKNR